MGWQPLLRRKQASKLNHGKLCSYIDQNYRTLSKIHLPPLHTTLRQGGCSCIWFPMMLHVRSTIMATTAKKNSITESVLWEISRVCVDSKPRSIEATCIISGDGRSLQGVHTSEIYVCKKLGKGEKEGDGVCLMGRIFRRAYGITSWTCCCKTQHHIYDCIISCTCENQRLRQVLISKTECEAWSPKYVESWFNLRPGDPRL